MSELFERYLNEKKSKQQKIKVYLKANQNPHDSNKVNNLMLSGWVKDVDEECLLLTKQECLIPLHSILSIKPSEDR